MLRAHRTAVAYVLASFIALAGVFVWAPAANADPGKIPDGSVDFYILGGSLAFGGQVSGTMAISQDLPHPDRPPECSDGVDNEIGNFHGWATNTPVTGTPLPPAPAAEGRIDRTGENAVLTPPGVVRDTGCATTTDNSELIDRQYIAPNPPDGLGRQCNPLYQASMGGTPVCGGTGAGVYNDACNNLVYATAQNCVLAPASSVFGNGTTAQGQEKLVQGGTGGTVSGTAVNVPQANLRFARGYQAQGQCQLNAGVSVCVNLYVEFKLTPAADITGVTNPDGSGSVHAEFLITVSLSLTYGSQNPFNIVPKHAICPGLSPISLDLVSGTSGSLTGVPYDTFRQNFKVVQDPFTVPAFATTQGQLGGNGANLCSQLNMQMFGADSPTASATNGQAELLISTQSSSNTGGSSASGPGMPWSVTNPVAASGPNWNPVSTIDVATNNGPSSGPMIADSTVQVDEGDLVALDSTDSYDPAMRPFTIDTFSRTGGTAPALPASTGAAGQTINFVAQDSPAGGMTYVFGKQVQTDLGPGTQTQQSTRTLTVNSNNVAPTAFAGASRNASGGLQQSLTGSSTDPGDVDAPGQRGYCWTQISGASVGLPACSGSPSNNRPSSAGRFTPLNFTPANADDSLTFQLVVCDKDGGCSAPSTVDYFVRAQSPSTISGFVMEGFSAIPGATVSLFNASGLVATDLTDGFGGYSFPGLAAGTGYFVQASASGYNTVYYDGAQSVNAAKRLTANGTSGRSDIDIQLVASGDLGSLTGNLVDTSSNPISGMGVRLYDEQGFVASTSTDGTGAYTFTNLAPKNTYRVRFNCAVGCGPAMPYVDMWHRNVAPGALTGNMATLETVPTGLLTNIGTDTMISTGGEQHSINGTVTGLAVPLERVQVRAYDANTGTWVASALTDAAGNYSMNVLPGDYKVWFWTKNTALTPAPPAATQARASQWYNGPGVFLTGEQTAGTGKLATTVLNAGVGGSSTISPDLP